MNLIDALTELHLAYDEAEPDRCAEAVQSVLDAFAPVARERPLHMVVDLDDWQAYGPFTVGQALDWARDHAGDPGLSDEEAEGVLGAAPLSLVTWDMPEPSWPGYGAVGGEDDYLCPCGWSRTILAHETRDDARRAHEATEVHRLARDTGAKEETDD